MNLAHIFGVCSTNTDCSAATSLQALSNFRAGGRLHQGFTANVCFSGNESGKQSKAVESRRASLGQNSPQFPMSDPRIRALVQQSKALAAGRGVQPLRLTIDGRKITLYAAPKPEERDDRVFPHMWVHCLLIRSSKGGLSVAKDTWAALTDASSTERTVHEWPAADRWIGLKPPVSFETKQSILHSFKSALHYWTDVVWSEERFKSEFKSWKSMRDAERDDMILMKRNPTWVVNPRSARPMGNVYASRADRNRARLAYIGCK
jgi:hypothetical protein